jgi:FtsZ-interacting cell division protein ZipA
MEVIWMLTAVLIVVGGLVAVALVVVGWWVRRMASDMDYPEARGSGLSPEESDAIRLGISLGGSSTVLGGH